MNARDNLDVIRELLPLKGTRVIDVGCGEGALTRFLAGEGAHVVGVEPGRAMIEKARAAPRIADEEFVAGTGEKLPLPDASVDAVVYLNALHHVPVADQEQAVREAARVLKPGGRFLVIEPLAEGVYFDLVRAVEDETEVRAAAYRALDAANRVGLRADREMVYAAPVKFADFAAFEARMKSVDPARAPIVDRLREDLARRFAAAGRSAADGVHFRQPTRANLFVKSS
ncbi:MAG TPA: class I SAM-dependent methyltransferase [Alphaproteobacteria bacterium]|nr:class I SAM-dependent methyltransferase [Alphaproteobacteria bacterium]